MQTRWLIKNKNSLLIVLKVKNKVMVLANLVLGESPLPHKWLSYHLNFMLEEARYLSGVSFIKALIPFMRTPPSVCNHFPKAPLPSNIVGVRISTYEFERH